MRGRTLSGKVIERRLRVVIAGMLALSRRHETVLAVIRLRASMSIGVCDFLSTLLFPNLSATRSSSVSRLRSRLLGPAEVLYGGPGLGTVSERLFGVEVTGGWELAACPPVIREDTDLRAPEPGRLRGLGGSTLDSMAS